MRKSFIYCLIDPRYNTIRYAGGTAQELEKRFKQHFTSAVSPKYPVNRWVKELRSFGLKPIIEILCVCETEDYEYDERIFIIACRAIGCDLLNVLDGGQLGNRSKKSSLTRQKISKAKIGTIHTAEDNEANRLRNLGKKMSPISVAKGVEKRKGYTHSDEVKQLISLNTVGKRKGIPLSKEHKENIALGKLGHIVTPETRELLRQASLNRLVSEETRQRMSVATTGELNGFYGKKHSEDAIKRMSESHIGQSPPNKGVPMSEEQKEKLRQAWVIRKKNKELHKNDF